MIGQVLKHPIWADHDSESLIVYQAFSSAIGEASAATGKLDVPGFSKNRMTWIKPSFLWMMYRSNWGKKDERQSCILKIRMKIDDFRSILESSTLASYDATEEVSRREWKTSLIEKPNRVQWDPDRDIFGEKTERRAIQVGVAPSFIEAYINSIIQIDNITNLCAEIKRKRFSFLDAPGKLPIERRLDIA